MVWRIFLLLCGITIKLSAMEDPHAVKLLALEATLSRQFSVSDEVWMPTFKKMIKKRIKYKVSLDREIFSFRCHYPSSLLYKTSFSDDRLSLTKKLLRHGADPNVVSETCVITPLCNALEYATTTKTVKVLLRAGANPNFIDPIYGSTPLHMACCYAYRYYLGDNRGTPEEKGRFKSIRLLLRYGANPNIQDKEGKTPLFKLISLPQEGMSIVVQLLLFGADITIKNNKGHDIFKYAKRELFRREFYTVNYLKDWKEGKIKLKKKKLK